MRRLLDGERFSHAGRFYRFDDALLRPRPVPGPPADPRRRRRAEEDAAHGRPPGRRVEHERDGRGGRGARRHPRASTARPSGATRRRSSGRSASRSSSATTPATRPARLPRPLRRTTGRPTPGTCRRSSARPSSSPPRSAPTSTSASARSSCACPRPYDAETIARIGEVRAALARLRGGVPRVVALAGGVGGARLAHGLAAGPRARRADGHRQHGRRRRVPRPPRLPGPRHRALHAGRPGRPRAGLGPGRRDVGRGRRCWSGSASRRGSASATGDLALHVHRTRRLREGVRLHRGQPRHPARARRRDADPADGRRAGPHAGPDARRLARLPGVLRPPPPGARRARGRLRRDRGRRARRPRSRRPSPRPRRIVLCPSNPFVSIGPILAVPGHARAPRRGPGPRRPGRRRLAPRRRTRAQGPGRPDGGARSAAESSATGIARLYAGLIDALLVDDVDAAEAPAIAALGIEPVVGPTVMGDDASRASLAAAAVAAAWRGAS